MEIGFEVVRSYSVEEKAKIREIYGGYDWNVEIIPEISFEQACPVCWFWYVWVMVLEGAGWHFCKYQMWLSSILKFWGSHNFMGFMYLMTKPCASRKPTEK